MDFFLIFSYKYSIFNIYIYFLIFSGWSGLTRVNPSWPIKPRTRPFNRVNLRVGFNNYDKKDWIWNANNNEYQSLFFRVGERNEGEKRLTSDKPITVSWHMLPKKKMTQQRIKWNGISISFTIKGHRTHRRVPLALLDKITLFKCEMMILSVIKR